MPRRPPPILCVAAASALLVACLIKPSPPAARSGDGGVPPVDVGGAPGDGGGTASDGGSGGPGGSCTTQTQIDSFNGVNSEPCTTGASASGGQLDMSASGYSTQRCDWTPATIGKGVVVEVASLTAGGQNYTATAKLQLKLGTSTTTYLQVALPASSTNYVVSATNSRSDQPSIGAAMWLLLQIVDDSHLSAKYRRGSFDSDLSNWTQLGEQAFGSGTTTLPPTVTLELDSAGSGTGSTSFTSFEYCQ